MEIRMFDFDKPEDGSQGRFDQDLAHNPAPADKIKHRGWWLAHNCVAHPLIGLAPLQVDIRFPRLDEPQAPRVSSQSRGICFDGGSPASGGDEHG